MDTNLITVAIIYHNDYKPYLTRAIESVHNQELYDWEVEIITINNTGKPLAAGCNKALKLAKGAFFIRLDADDYLHPNALQVMADILSGGEYDAVYPDFWEVNEAGQKIGYNSIYESLEHNPLGAGVMFWTQALREVGYDESLHHQEAYDLMRRFKASGFRVYELKLPLYYRTRHSRNMSSDTSKIVHTRSMIRAKEAKILCVIPAKANSVGCPRKNLRVFANGETLPQRAYTTASKSAYVDRVVIVTNDSQWGKQMRSFGYECVLEGQNPTKSALGAVASIIDLYPDYDVIIQYQPTSPFVRPEHLDEGIERLFRYDLDSVVSIKEMQDHPVRALQIVGNEVHPYNSIYDERILNRQDLPDAFKFNGAFYIRRRRLYEEWLKDPTNFALGKKVGFVLMSKEESVDINDELDWKLAKLLEEEND